MTNRRKFIVQLGVTSGVVFAGQARAQGAMLAETDPQAVTLGYKADTSKVDAKKYPKHASAQSCKKCALYQGKPGDASGGCPLFAGKQVAANGWCSSWAKKA